MAPPREAIPTMSTGDVTFADDEVAFCESFDVIAYAINNTHKLVTDDDRHWNCFLRPSVPVGDVHVGTADRRLQHPNQHVVVADFWNKNILEPKTGLCFGFDNRLHRLHYRKARRSKLAWK